MKSLLVLLAVTAALGLAAPAGARPIDVNTPSSSSAPAPAPVETSGGGSDAWVVILAAGLAFVAGAAGTRLVAVPRTGRAAA